MSFIKIMKRDINHVIYGIKVKMARISQLLSEADIDFL